MSVDLPLVPLEPERLPTQLEGMDTLIAEFLAGKKATTVRAYSGDLQRFADYLGKLTITEMAQRLFLGGHGKANRIVMAYKAHLLDRNQSSASINRSLASIRALVKFARLIGMVTWPIDVAIVRHEKRKENKGPDLRAFQRLLQKAGEQANPFKAERDTAILWLFGSLALRERELIGLNLSDIDLIADRIRLKGKGDREWEWMVVPPETMAVLHAWLEMRGKAPGPVFPNLDRGGSAKGKPISASGLRKMLAQLGRSCGMRVWPHGLRHTSITTALDNAPLRLVRHFSRHADLKTLMVYDDSRSDHAGDIAKKVAKQIAARPSEIAAAVARQIAAETPETEGETP
jgi:integrase/recombinase XerC